MRILFVCHGNICRSVMAEMMLRHLLNENGITDVEVDSCATSTEEIGNDIYPPAQACLRRHGVPFTHHKARQMTQNDYAASDRIFCMDHNNLRNLRRLLGDNMDKVKLLLDREVADPWYTGDFETTYCDLLEGCQRLLEENSLNPKA